MKRRIPFKFIPINRALLYSGNTVFGRQDGASLADKLGLKPLAAQQDPSPAPDYLDQWMDAPRYPVWDPECPLGRVFVMAIHNHHPCTFLYHGGSTPGAKRTVYPAQVFTVGSSETLYLAAWCMGKEAHRVFRVDRVRLLG